MSDEQWMRAAVDAARQGIEAGQTPFGAAIVRDDQLIAVSHNRVWASTDITAHAEVAAIRDACRLLQSIDLTGCTIYSTCEPCPMCFSACHWARIGRIVFGASIADAAASGFNELQISNTELIRLSASRVQLTGGLLRAECCELFSRWLKDPRRRVY